MAVDRVAVAEREALAVAMRKDGATYEQIGTALGCSASRACHIVTRALHRMVSDEAQAYRDLHVAQLLDAMAECRRQMRLDHVFVSNGEVVRTYVDEDGNGCAVVDEAGKLRAIDRLLRVQDRMARLLGMDAPTKHQVLTDDLLADEIARLEAVLEDETGAAPPGP